MSIKEKIKTSLDSLEGMMKKQDHLKEDKMEELIEVVDFLTKCSSALSEEDREFFAAARFAIRAKMRWE